MDRDTELTRAQLLGILIGVIVYVAYMLIAVRWFK
jgi:hypothetical protein